jgi:hypothetical protein
MIQAIQVNADNKAANTQIQNLTKHRYDYPNTLDGLITSTLIIVYAAL